MSRFRKVEQHLKQLKELQSIISSMKTLAQLEIRKLSMFTESQQAMMNNLEQIATDFLTFFPRRVHDEKNTTWLLIGSERGFCAGFNKSVLNSLLRECPECIERPGCVVVVGRKLCRIMDETLPGCTGLKGACASEEIPSILTQVAAATQKQMLKHNSATLQILFHGDEHGTIVARRLLPPAKTSSAAGRHRTPPLLYLEPDRFFSHFLQHYLLLGLTQLFTVSLLAENQFRLQHMEGALHKLDKRLTRLTSQARTLRQEAITEEIEMILLGSGAYTL